MKIELFVSETFEPCRDAERVWSDAVRERDIELTVVDINSAEGQARAQQLAIGMVPALVVNGRLRAVGVQSPVEARNLLAAACGG